MLLFVVVVFKFDASVRACKFAKCVSENQTLSISVS